MRKVVRLTESDLLRIVKRVIRESDILGTPTPGQPNNTPKQPNNTPGQPNSNTTSGGYYYKPGEKHDSEIMVFPFSDPVSSTANKAYDVMGKPTVRFDLNTYVNMDKVNPPKVPTIWFTIYDGSTGKSKLKMVGYNINQGVITDPETSKVLFSPGKNLDAPSVYKWLYYRSDKGGPMLVGNIQRG